MVTGRTRVIVTTDPRRARGFTLNPSAYPRKRSPPRVARQPPRASGPRASVMPDVRNAKEDNGVPAHHAEIKQVGDPHELSHPKNDENSDHLSEQDTAGRTQDFCKAPYQRVQFEGAVMKRDQGRSQIKHLKHDKAGPGSQDIGDLHLVEGL